MEVWQRGFQDHRIRDAEDYAVHVRYIHDNPVRARLCGAPHEYRWSSAYPGYLLDEFPQGLKPKETRAPLGAAEAAPFQNTVPADEEWSEAGRIPPQAESDKQDVLLEIAPLSKLKH